MSKQRRVHHRIVSWQEKYRHMRKVVSSTNWHLPPRQRQIVNLNFDSRHGFKDTYWFYVMNWVAYKYPEIIKELW